MCTELTNEACTTRMNARTNIPSLGILHLYTGTRSRHTPACAACTCTSRLSCTRCVRSGGQARRSCAQSQRYSEEAILKQPKTQAHKHTEGHTHKLTGKHPCSPQAWTHTDAHTFRHPASVTHTHAVQKCTHEHLHTAACLPTFRSVPLSRMVSMRS